MGRSRNVARSSGNKKPRIGAARSTAGQAAVTAIAPEERPCNVGAR
jgi:hypothetical protein